MNRIVLYTVIIAIHIFLISIFIFSGDSSDSSLTDESSPTPKSQTEQTKDVNMGNDTQSNSSIERDDNKKETNTQEEQYYTVKPGDSLMKISKKFYGSSKYYKFIYESNRDVLKSLSSIKVGQDLVIPPKPE